MAVLLYNLSALRAVAGRWLADTATITDPGTVTVTASGGTTIGGTTSTAGVPCALWSAGAKAARETFGDQLAAKADFLLLVPVGTALRVGWSVTVDGATSRVIAVAEGGSLNVMTKALIATTQAIGG